MDRSRSRVLLSIGIILVGILISFPPLAAQQPLRAEADSLHELSKKLYGNKDYGGAIRTALQSLEIKKQLVGTDDDYYLNTLSNVAVFYSAVHIDSALAIGRQIRDIYRQHDKWFSQGNYRATSNLASDLYKAGRQHFYEMKSVSEELLSITEQIFGRGEEFLNVCLTFASRCVQMDHYDATVEVLTEGLDLYEKIKGKDARWLLYKRILADGLDERGENKLAHAQYFEVEKTLRSHPDLLKDKNNLLCEMWQGVGKGYGDVGDYTNALRAEREALRIAVTPQSRYYCLKNIASCYAQLYDTDSAEYYAKKTTLMAKEVWGTESDQYLLSLLQESIYSIHRGNIIGQLEILDSLERVFSSKGNINYESRISLAKSQYYRYTNNYVEAEKCLLKSLGMTTNFLSAVKLKSQLAEYYCNMGRYAESNTIIDEMLDTIETVEGERSEDYLLCLQTKSMNLMHMGKHDAATQSLQKILQITDSDPDGFFQARYLTITSLAKNYYTQGLFADARRQHEEASKMEKNKGVLLDKRKQNIYNLMLVTLEMKDYHSTEQLMSQYLREVKRLLAKDFTMLSKFERQNLFNAFEKKVGLEMHRLVYKHLQTDTTVSVGCDAILFSKGLLMSTERAVSELIARSNDDESRQLLDTLKLIRLQIEKLYKQEPSKRTLSVDELEKQADALERRLLKKNKTYGDLSKNFSIGWREVKSNLKKDEAAVEFVSFDDEDSSYYAAYVIRPESRVPQWVTLGARPLTERLSDDKVYTSQALSQWLWGNMANILKGAKKVFFSPAGELFNIGIEYMPDYEDSTKHIWERWQLYRLSSTRELALTKEAYRSSGSAVYGGLRYSTDTTFLKRDSERHHRHTTERSLYSIADSVLMRDGAAYLPGTRIEAINIDSTLRVAKIDNQMFVDTLGTETSFKSLSGKHKKILHISTHGFYWTKKEAQSKKNIQLLNMGGLQNENRYYEDEALTRSGLLFSGANVALKGGMLPEGIDDGILTAKEIAEMNLEGLDMVVLSACQTGLGEISGDGVFGLQRGLKKAGAQSIMMSLWKVDDEATRILMTRFYHYWTSGSSKHIALSKAQNDLKNYTETRVVVEDDGEWKADEQRIQHTVTVHPYTSPHYWAAFILLDAID